MKLKMAIAVAVGIAAALMVGLFGMDLDTIREIIDLSKEAVQ